MKTWLLYGAIAAIRLSAPFFVSCAKPESMEASELVGYGGMVPCLGATWFAMHGECERSRPIRVVA